MSEEDKPNETPTDSKEEEKTAGEDEAPKEEESTATFEPVVRLDVLLGDRGSRITYVGISTTYSSTGHFPTSPCCLLNRSHSTK
jgi:hypothetical protein